MVRIGICDDEPVVVEQIRGMLDKLDRTGLKRLEIVEFYSGEKLLESISKGSCYDLLYLDIEMHQLNGINVAKKIREKDVNMLIIYVSGNEGYYRDLFDVEPFRFIIKPIDERLFLNIFLKAEERITIQEVVFTFQTNKSIVKLPLNDIMYFDSAGRVITIHTQEKEYRYYDKLDLVEETVKADCDLFIRVHKSYLVNFKYIKIFETSKVIMRDEKEISISDERRNSAKKAYMKLIRGDKI